MPPINDIILTERITTALERIADTFCPRQEEPCHSWVVFIETRDMNGSPSYTYQVGASYCDTGEQAIKLAVARLPRLEEGIRLGRAYAARATDVTEFDYIRFQETPQFQVKP